MPYWDMDVCFSNKCLILLKSLKRLFCGFQLSIIFYLAAMSPLSFLTVITIRVSIVAPGVG